MLHALVAVLVGTAIIVPPLPGPHASGDGIPGAVPAPTIPVASTWTPSGLGAAIEAGYIKVKFLEGVTIAASTNFTVQVEADGDNAASGAVEVRPVCVGASGLVTGDNGTGTVVSWKAETWADPMVFEGVSVLVSGNCAIGEHREVMTWATITSDPNWEPSIALPAPGWHVIAPGNDGYSWYTDVGGGGGSANRVWARASGLTTTRFMDFNPLAATYGQTSTVTVNSTSGLCVSNNGYSVLNSIQVVWYDTAGTIHNGGATGSLALNGSSFYPSSCALGNISATLTRSVTEGFGHIEIMGGSTHIASWWPSGSPSGLGGGGGTSYRSLGVWEALDAIRYYPVGGGTAWRDSGACTSVDECLNECQDAMSFNPLTLFDGFSLARCLVTPRVSPWKVVGAAGSDVASGGLVGDAALIFRNTAVAFDAFVGAASAGCGLVGTVPIGRDASTVNLLDTCSLDSDVGGYLRAFIIALVGIGGLWSLLKKGINIFFPFTFGGGSEQKEL